LLENLGARTLQSLALVAEVVHGTPTRFSDPARFSFALGGKDGHPFPVPLKTYDETISVLRQGLEDARLGSMEKTDGLRRLDRFVQVVKERHSPDAHFPEAIKHEHAVSASMGGRTVFDDRKKPRFARQQLALF
jgi:hypothetical protein